MDPMQIMERLRKAEAEAAALRAKLAESQREDNTKAAQDIQVQLQDKEEQIKNTNELRRGGRQGNDMAGPSEAELIRELGLQELENKDEIIRKRFLISLGGAAVLGGLAFIPTQSHKVPTEPASFYLAPVIRSKYILDDIQDSIRRKRWKKELQLVKQILQSPNYLSKNILSAAQTLPNDDDWRAADGLARELVENIRALDYQEYFQTEEPNAEQMQFLDEGVDQCVEKLDDFLNMMPTSEYTKAKAEADRTKSAVARDDLDYS